jgi:hypothetical protein
MVYGNEYPDWIRIFMDGMIGSFMAYTIGITEIKYKNM